MEKISLRTLDNDLFKEEVQSMRERRDLYGLFSFLTDNFSLLLFNGNVILDFVLRIDKMGPIIKVTYLSNWDKVFADVHSTSLDNLDALFFFIEKQITIKKG